MKADLTEIGSQTRRNDITLVPLEPLAVTDGGGATFWPGIHPPWAKDAWTDPEAEGTS